LAELWDSYVWGKQTKEELSIHYGVSASTIKRKLGLFQSIPFLVKFPKQGVLLMDATYWGRNWGVLVIMDASSGLILWKKYIKKERLMDYRQGVDFIELQGYKVMGIVCDGMKGLFQLFAQYKVQMCQFHQVAIIRRYITINPKLEAGKELKAIVKLLTKTDKESFIGLFNEWLYKWDTFLKERRIDAETGKSRYVHKRLRSACLSIKRNLPYLFVYLEDMDLNIPNTNNKLEGTFTGLKNKLRNHNGLSKENRKRFIDEFFKA